MISVQAVRAWRAFQEHAGRWMTHQGLAEAAGINQWTARRICARLVRLGLVEEAEVGPAYRYRLSGESGERYAAYAARINKAAECFADIDGIPDIAK